VEAVRFAQVNLGFEMRAQPPLASEMVRGALDALRSGYPAFSDALRACGESRLSDLSDPGPVVAIDATRYTTSQLAVVGHMFYVASRLGGLPASVLEIGGGYGAPARAWLTCGLGRLHRYVILDLPESLFFSEVFLAAHFGFEAVLNLADPEAAGKVGRASVVLCPVQRMSLLNKLQFDVVLNTGSMQEMTDDWIDVYTDLLSEIDVGHFYSANYFLQPIDRMNESMNVWAPRLGPDWTAEDFQFCPPTAGSDSRSSLLAFYRHERDDSAPAESAEKILDRLQARVSSDPLTPQEGRDIAIVMDFFRRRPSAQLALKLARLLSGAFPRVCKESAYFVDWLLARPDLVGSPGGRRNDGIAVQIIPTACCRKRRAGMTPDRPSFRVSGCESRHRKRRFFRTSESTSDCGAVIPSACASNATGGAARIAELRIASATAIVRS
jgi:hypothetical protein